MTYHRFAYKVKKIRKTRKIKGFIYMSKTYLTTSEAAKLLSVSPDTVLKWVRAQKIESYRTPGGHSRIPYEAIANLLPEGQLSPEEPEITYRASEEPIYKYCWDFYAHGEEIKDDCLNCVAYKSRAHRCYEMRDLPEEFGLLRLHCKTDCKECDYYQAKEGQSANAIILIRDRKQVQTLENQAKESDTLFQFASHEYECSALIEKFLPDFVVVDCSFGLSRTQDLCQQLIHDQRIPNIKIILSSKKAKIKDYCDNEAFGWITKPFTIEQLEKLIHGAMKTG
ncbi:MAG: helix-turn-helix domain-containing protein [Planctomycetota bacterium]